MKTAYATIKGIEVMRVHYAKAGPQHFIMVIPGRNAPGKQSF
jgi:hypothetical protein